MDDERNIFEGEEDQRSGTVPLEQYDRAVEELTEALRATAELLGKQVLPPTKGSAWYDALVKYTPIKAAKFLEGIV